MREPTISALDRRDDALATATRAVALAPDDLRALNTRGLILETLGRYDDALADFESMLAHQPNDTDALNNRGLIFARIGQFDEALACYDQSLRLQPEQPQALYNRSIVQLSLGDWIGGFREFESRWQVAPLKAVRLTTLQPLWLGQTDLAGKTLLLHHEQGYGDTLQCVRYVPLLVRRGARVVLAVPAALCTLLKALPVIPTWCRRAIRSRRMTIIAR